MAVTLSAPETSPQAALGELTYSFAIQKFARDEDGDLVVSGVATDGSVDSDRQIVDEGWSGGALAQWKASGANVRMAHDPRRPIGKGLRLDINKDGDGKHWVHSVVVDRDAQRLIEKGVLTAYSVGIMNPVIKRDPTGRAPGGIICGGEIGELSIVDRPANKSAYLQIAKAAGDGTPEFTGTLYAPPDVLAKAADSGLTSVELPSDMKLKVTPAILTKMATLKRNLVLQEQALKASVPAIVKADLKDSERAGMPAGDFAYVDPEGGKHLPVHDEGHVRSALGRFTQQHFESGAAKRKAAKKIVSRARGMGIDLADHGTVVAAAKVAAPGAVKGEDDKLGQCPTCKGRGFTRKPANQKCEACGGSGRATGKTVTADAVKCMKCDDSGMLGEKPCPDCKKGRKAQKATAALEAAASAPIETLVAKKKGKMRAVCPNCGAKQNPDHAHCPECGKPLPARALQVKKNHDFVCLHCGGELDKGEPHCPECGKENPGYLPEADRKIPANMEADKSAGKDRVAKAKKKSGKKGKPFGVEDQKDEPGKAEKRRKGGKKRYGRDPAEGVTGHDTTGLPPHREPDGAPVEQFENDAHLEDGDQQMKAALRHKSLGIEPHLAVLHDLTCPAFSPKSVTDCLPHATFAGIDTAWWSDQALKAAAGSDMAVALQRYNELTGLSRTAVMLKTADPQVMHRIRMAQHEAFLEANADVLGKTFRDATPGPGTAPTPAHVMPQSFRRPYIPGGHAAESPQAEGARTFPVISDHPQAQDFHRGYLSAGRASESPENTGRSEPVPTGPAGSPHSVAGDAARMQERDYSQATATMHDHLARIAPGMCPMSPPMGSTQGAAHPVPDPVGMIEPRGKASKADKAAQKAAAKAKAAKKAARVAARKAKAQKRKLERQALKAAAPSPVTSTLPGEVTYVAPVPALDAEAVAAAVKAATAPLVKRMRTQDKRLRRNQKVLDAIAGQPDTSQAPFRGAGVYKASAAPAAPQTAAEAAAQAQTGHLQRLRNDWRNSHIPEVREAAYKELTAQLGLNPMTDNPTHRNPFTT